MLNKTTAFTLIETLFAITIIAILTSSFYISFNKFLYLQQANLSLEQLQSALNYARSIAILTHESVIVCPSTNKVSCSGSGSWQQGILVVDAQANTRFFQMFNSHNVTITLLQSGFQQQSVRIHGDGMTYTNGHFTYISANPRYIPRFNLYFNRGFRTYVRTD